MKKMPITSSPPMHVKMAIHIMSPVQQRTTMRNKREAAIETKAAPTKTK